MKIRHFLFFIVFIALSSFGQNERVFWNYDISHGLPTNTIYHGLIDSKNRVWFGSDKGVTCFNGISFKTYTVDDGLPDNTVIRCYEDSQGRIWFHHLNQLPSYFQNGHIKQISGVNNEQFVVETLSKFVELDNGNIVIGGFHGLLIIHPNDDIKIIPCKENARILSHYQENNTLYFSSKFDGENVKTKLLRENIKSINIVKEYEKYKEMSANALDQSTFCRSESLIQHIKSPDRIPPNQFHQIFPITSRFYHIVMRRGFVYVGSEKGLFKFKRNNNSLDLVDTLLENISIVSVNFDKKGNLWATSNNEGLFFLTHLKYDFIPFPKGKQMFKIKPFNDKIYVTGLSEHIFSFDGNQFLKEKLDRYEPIQNKLISDFFLSNKYRLILTESNIHVFDKRSQKNKILKTHFPVSVIFDNQNNDNQFQLSGYSGITQLTIDEKNVKTHDKNTEIGRIRQLATFEKVIYAGTQTGLFDCTKEKVIPFYPNIFEKSRINALKVIGKSLFIGTTDKGLFQYSEGALTRFSAISGLFSNTVIGIYKAQEPDCAWIHTATGLQKICFVNKKFKVIISIDLKTPFKVDEISDLLERKNHLLILTKKGLLKLPLNQDFSSPKLTFYLQNYTINDLKKSYSKNTSITTKSQNISFFLETVNQSAHNIELFYRINDGPWIQNETGHYNFSALQSGNYTFEFKASSPLQGASVTPKIELEVTKVWYQYTWFIGALFLLILISVSFFVRWRIMISQNKKNRFLTNEIMALQSQMNPHFTFNSLNSIQNYLSNNDKRSAQIYLADFAILMRKIMEQAKISLISLDEEVDFLRQYLKLEKQRLNESFDYRIHIDPAIQQLQQGIPTLMLQPFVENAIWHGVATLEYPGIIDISFTLSKNKIICTIQDNGHGLNVEKNKNSIHKSAGINNCKERMALFKELYHKEITLSIIDKKSESTGVCVEIIIPKLILEK